MDDWQLLNEYAAKGSEEAFRMLADRYAGMVYHAALRQLGNPHAAEEAAQAVFIALAAKAGRIPRGTVLSAWLFRATRFAVLNQLRAEASRQRHEREAFHMQPAPETNDPDPVWAQITPHLNDALDRLPQKDREAVMSRFFENKSHRDVAKALGVSEDAAKMRVSRALERLRDIFASRGIAVTSVALAATLGAHAAQAAPLGLASTVAAAGIAKGAGGGGALASAKGILKLMAWAKLKAAAVVIGSALLAAGTTAVIVEQSQQSHPPARAGEPLAGKVVQPDGTPATNVTVYLCLDSEFLDLSPDGHLGPPMVVGRDGQPQVMNGYTVPNHTQTGPDGRFVFNAWTAPACLLATDERGFAMMSASNLTQETPLILKPLATIAGTVFVGAKPAVNAIVRLTPVDPEQTYPDPFWASDQILDNKVTLWGTHLQTDAEGRFSFRVPAGDYRVNHAPGWELQSFFGTTPDALTQPMPVHAEGGRTNTVKVGGEGRTVVGRLEGVSGTTAWTNQFYYVEKTVPGPGPMPAGMTGEGNWKRVKDWYHSPEGQAAVWSARRYAVQTEPDGRFKIQDLPPGEYQLNFPLAKEYVHTNRANGGRVASSMDLATASTKFTIGPLAPGRDPDADPLDLGVLHRDWITNWVNLWIKDDILVPLDQPPRAARGGQRRGGPDPDEIAALETQVKARQSAKTTAGETTIDLFPFTNAKLNEPLGEEIYIKNNTLAELPSGTHVYGGVPFNVSGLVQLNSSSMYPYVRPLPEEAGGIAIGRKFKKLHLLNGAVEVQALRSGATIMRENGRGRRNQPERGPVMEAIAKLVLHYADGSQAELPIMPGEQLLEFEGPFIPSRLPDLPSSTELAWMGTNPYLKEYHPDRALHLYRTTFNNPKPDLEVKSVDYVSTMTPTAPFMAGLTVE